MPRPRRKPFHEPRSLGPNVFLLVSSENESPLAALRSLLAGEESVAVVVLVLDSEEIPRDVLRAGATAILSRGSPLDAVISTLRSFRSGGRGDSTVPPSSGLSRREVQVLTMIADGFTNKQIADALGISVRTVETHRERLMRKLDVQGTAALTKAAITLGLVHTKQ